MDTREREAGVVQETANDRFKRGFGNWFWGGLIAATAIHFVMFMFWPNMTSADVSFNTNELKAVELPPEIKIPPPPQAIARPAAPVVSADASVNEDVTIAPTTFSANPVSNLPPPPSSSSASGDVSKAPTFTPYTVAPDLKNRAEVQAALEKYYPPLLKDAGIGGTVMVWFFIDEAGHVQKNLIKESSGHQALDEAAIKVANIMDFSPALNRDKKVPVWVALPIVFRTK
jgi:periplasmic protein TonB